MENMRRNMRRNSTTNLMAEDVEVNEPNTPRRNQFYKMHRTLALIDKNMTGVRKKICNK